MHCDQGSASEADMLVAAAVASAIDEDRFCLTYQPICDGDRLDDALYCECLLRMIDTEGRIQTPDAFIPALERLGLARSLDQWVLKRVIQMLRDNPAVHLGCNISAQSAVNDGWWTPIIAALAADRTIASRLVIEITETAPLPRAETVESFVDAMRVLGCRIAIDDFGVGHSTPQSLVWLKPDIVKIDGVFVRRRDLDAGGPARLARLIALASSFADQVIVEGIESAADLRAARAVGATWVQGYYVAFPSAATAPMSLRGVERAGGIAIRPEGGE